MRPSSKRQKGEAEVTQTWERDSLPDQGSMPKLNNGRLNLGFELEFRWGRDEYLEWVRQGILGCSLAERGKPGVWDTMV